MRVELQETSKKVDLIAKTAEAIAPHRHDKEWVVPIRMIAFGDKNNSAFVKADMTSGAVANPYSHDFDISAPGKYLFMIDWDSGSSRTRHFDVTRDAGKTVIRSVPDFS